MQFCDFARLRLAARFACGASLAIATLLSLGCGARYLRVPLQDAPDLMVALRSEVKNGAPVPRGFAHPAAISALRAANVLARVEVRESAGDASARRPAVPGALTHKLGGALASALARADATQAVVVRATRSERRLGVFSRTFATSFVAFIDAQNRLQLVFVDADRELPAGENGAQPEPIAGRGTQAIKAVPGPHVEALGTRGFAVDWRADLFREAVPESESGRRRTILMESTTPGALKASVNEHVVPADPERLRALAELDAARRAGTLSEAEYQRRRAELAVAPGD